MMNTKRMMIAGLGVSLAAASVMVSAVVASAAGTSITATVSSTIANPVVVTTPACPVFGRSLSFGATGSDVTALQDYLNERGYLGVSATGYFGPLTQSAVARWQADGGVVALGGYGSGTFGPLSRGYFARSCGNTIGFGSGSGSTSSTQALSFSASPSTGVAPLSVQFVVTAPQGTTVGNSINFGDGTSGTLGFVPVCSSCNLMATASHTYASSGTYTAELMSGACSCPANGVCNCPNLMILATTTVTVTATGSSGAATSSIQQFDAPGSVTLAPDGIAEVRNASFYFTLASATASAATIDITPVGCWNSFPSDPPPMVRCMIAVVPTPPQTLSVGQKYMFGNYDITLTALDNGTATFEVQ